jgi:hypothetical protein
MFETLQAILRRDEPMVVIDREPAKFVEPTQDQSPVVRIELPSEPRRFWPNVHLAKPWVSASLSV